jgi:glycine/sarcosine N-methyltransferase
MSLYQILAPLYDGLFPASQEATDFLAALVPGRGGSRHARSLLDAGCATGTQALEMAALGWTAIGIDTEGAMIEIARRKAFRDGLAGQALFSTASMLEIGELYEGRSFDLVLCLGNSLPHLSRADSASFLSQARGLLVTGGALVVQTLNYSLPRVAPGFAFPEVSAQGAVLRRSYRAAPDGRPDVLSYVVELERGDLRESGEALLTPLEPGELASLLAEAGFGSLRACSAWDGAVFDESEDLYCITVARA